MAAGFIIKHGEWSNTQAPNKQKGYLINKNIGTSFNIGKSPIHSYISQTCGYHWRNTACKTDSWFVDDTAVSNNLENTQVSLSIEGHLSDSRALKWTSLNFEKGTCGKFARYGFIPIDFGGSTTMAWKNTLRCQLSCDTLACKSGPAMPSMPDPKRDNGMHQHPQCLIWPSPNAGT